MKKKAKQKRLSLWLLSLFSFLGVVLPLSVMAITAYPLPQKGEDIVGWVRQIETAPGDNLEFIARTHGSTLHELQQANPNLDKETLTSPGGTLYLSSAYILPPGPRQGLVINLSEMRFYYFSEKEGKVYTAPASVGRPGWETPLAEDASIIDKEYLPTWHVPQSIRNYTAKNGFILPEEIPPGSDNPLGDHMLRLSLHGYLIHGTNEPYSIGKPITSGCLRLYPEDVEWLYQHVAIGTPVRIINQPIKVGKYHGKLFVEAHSAIANDEKESIPSDTLLIDNVFKKSVVSTINWQHLKKIVARKTGYPEQIN